MKSGIDSQGLGLGTAFAFRSTSSHPSCSRGVLCLQGFEPLWDVRETADGPGISAPRMLGVRMGLAVVRSLWDMPGWRETPVSSAT